MIGQISAICVKVRDQRFHEAIAGRVAISTKRNLPWIEIAREVGGFSKPFALTSMRRYRWWGRFRRRYRMNHDHVQNTWCYRLVLTVSLGGVTLLSGCATARLNQYRGFSLAGVAYTKASQTLTDQAGTASISADTAILLKNRPDLPADDRR